MKSLKVIPIAVALASLGGALYYCYKIYSEHIRYDFMNTHGYADTDSEAADDEFSDRIRTAEDYMFVDSENQA